MTRDEAKLRHGIRRKSGRQAFEVMRPIETKHDQSTGQDKLIIMQMVDSSPLPPSLPLFQCDLT